MTGTAKKGPQPEEDAGLDAGEQQEVEEHQQLPALVIYEAVRQQGQDELERPVGSLWWSGLTAGLGMGLSLAAQGAIHSLLPDAGWRPLVECFGYAAGFVIVILSRHQLFTENTLSGMLPVLHPPMGKHAGKLVRLWSIVFLANLVGTALFALVLLTPVVSEDLRNGMVSVARELGHRSTSDVFWRAIPAGWLIATLVWMLPSAETAKVWVIIGVTYLISLFQLTHVVAGAAEVFLLIYRGEMGLGTGLGGFIAPMLVGNILGGSVLFAILSFGQVKDEIG
jgi:formate/nitrite transporter FocA (FNT family)